VGLINRMNIEEFLASDNIEEAAKLTIREYPSEIYKIFPPDLCRIDSLWNNEIWFSDPCFFDDPFDTGYWINHQMSFQSILDSTGLTKGQLEYPDAMEQVVNIRIEKLRNEIKSNYLICSLTEDITSSVLWSQYGLFHKGFAVQYNLKSIETVDLNYFVFPVMYTDKFIDFEAILKTNPKTWEYLLCLIKGVEWRYQKEWRAIKKVIDNSKKDKGQLLKCPKIEAVYLGFHSDKSLRNFLLRFAKEKNIWLYEMSVLPNKLEILPKPIHMPK
jgi:hypothetical protein